MKRVCTIVASSDQFPNRHICVDLDVWDEIEPLIFDGGKYQNKFEYISGRILGNANMYYDDYERIYNKGGIRVSEMRFFPNGDNCRIYCREVTINGQLFCIVMAKLLPKKKPQKINKAIQQMVDSIKDYEYELQE